MRTRFRMTDSFASHLSGFKKASVTARTASPPPTMPRFEMLSDNASDLPSPVHAGSPSPFVVRDRRGMRPDNFANGLAAHRRRIPADAPNPASTIVSGLVEVRRRLAVVIDPRLCSASPGLRNVSVGLDGEVGWTPSRPRAAIAARLSPADVQRSTRADEMAAAWQNSSNSGVDPAMPSNRLLEPRAGDGPPSPQPLPRPLPAPPLARESPIRRWPPPSGRVPVTAGPGRARRRGFLEAVDEAGDEAAAGNEAATGDEPDAEGAWL